MDWACNRCGALWSKGEFTAGCETCAGGGMERACPLCKGACGQRWSRAPLDSLDSGIGHWVGRCARSENR